MSIFCPECDTYLTTKISTNSEDPNKLLSYYCNNCGYNKTIDISREPEHKCLYQTNYNNKLIKINQKHIQYLKFDPTIPHIDNIPCPNLECPTKKETPSTEVLPTPTNIPTVKNDILYIKLNESDLTFLYQCCNCNHTWTNK